MELVEICRALYARLEQAGMDLNYARNYGTAAYYQEARAYYNDTRASYERACADLDAYLKGAR